MERLMSICKTDSLKRGTSPMSNGNHLAMKMKGDSHSDTDSDTDEQDSRDFPKERDKWNKKAEYVLSMIGYCVGLGNIWRFPYVCMRNGGGAFLIPYVLSLFICGFPIFFLEVSLGQFRGKSPWDVWNLCPLLRGVGLSMYILCLVWGWYFSIILGWCLIYMVNSLKSPLPWTQCGQSWNTENCIVPEDYWAQNGTDVNSTASLYLAGNSSADMLGNDTLEFLTNETQVNRIVSLSTEEFWLYNVLEITSGIHDMGGLPWHTVVALIVSNLVVLAAHIRGINSSGKVVYVTATLPYLLIGVILIMGCTLPGSGDGILFYIKPDFGKLFVIQTWIEAAIQIFYSLGPAWGCLITMASYNKFHNNCLKDSIVLAIVCEGTSVFGGFAIFSILGHMAYVAKVPIMEFAKSGAGLAFIVYPEAISYLPLPQLWGVIFFLTLFTVGLDSQFACVEALITTVGDLWPILIRRYRTLTTSSFVGFLTLAGLLFTSRGGSYMFQLIDWYIATFSLLIQACLECVIVAWIYGADRFCYDVQLMIGSRPPRIIVILWKFITPTLLIVLFFITMAFYEPPTFAGYSYPLYALVIGWIISILPFLSIVLYAGYVLLRSKGSLKKRVLDSCRPPHSWQPSDADARRKYCYEAFKLSDLESDLPRMV